MVPVLRRGGNGECGDDAKPPASRRSLDPQTVHVHVYVYVHVHVYV
jgi:hypothetical protein